MNVLVVTYDAPALTTGFPKRNAYLLRSLCEAHRVTLLIVTDDPVGEGRKVEALGLRLEAVHTAPAPHRAYKRVLQAVSIPLRRPSVMLRNSPPAAGRAIRALLASKPFDAVVFQSATLANHRLPPSARVVIDEHNLEYELMERSAEQAMSAARRLHYTLEAAALKSAELGLLKRADLVSVTSERERRRLEELLPGAHVVVTPNGVDCEAFAPDKERLETRGRVIFTGSMDYHPNEQAAHYFAEAIWPRVLAKIPEATWYLVGARPPASFRRLAALPGVTVTGETPQTQPYLAEAAVAIAPLLVGGGTRLKILEALAMEKAVVTTSLGCEGLDVVPGEHLLVADEPDAFAEAVTRLLQDDDLRARLGVAGRQLVERAYSWSRSGGAFARAVERLIERSAARPAVGSGD